MTNTIMQSYWRLVNTHIIHSQESIRHFPTFWKKSTYRKEKNRHLPICRCPIPLRGYVILILEWTTYKKQLYIKETNSIKRKRKKNLFKLHLWPLQLLLTLNIWLCFGFRGRIHGILIYVKCPPVGVNVSLKHPLLFMNLRRSGHALTVYSFLVLVWHLISFLNIYFYQK